MWPPLKALTHNAAHKNREFVEILYGGARVISIEYCLNHTDNLFHNAGEVMRWEWPCLAVFFQVLPQAYATLVTGGPLKSHFNLVRFMH